MSITPPNILTPGMEIADTYVLEHTLGQGGMGQVWAARHLRLGHAVAIKFAVQGGPELAERFLSEARLAAAVTHRHIVDVIDVGMAGSRPYLVMELVEGETLADVIYDCPLEPHDAVAIIAQLLSALDSCHAAGVIHRDLKPENVFVARNEDGPFATLVDFGISKAIKTSESRPPRRSAIPTQRGAVVGTPEYMAPEQARGSEMDHRVDIYALGVMLYELLANALPFEGLTPVNVIAAVLEAQPQSMEYHAPELPELGRVVHRAMDRDPNARFESAAEMRAALMEAARIDLNIERLSTTGVVPKSGDTPPSGVSVRRLQAAEAETMEPALHDAPTLTPDEAQAAIVAAGVSDTVLAPRSRRWFWVASLVAVVVTVALVQFGSAKASRIGPKVVTARSPAPTTRVEQFDLPQSDLEQPRNQITEAASRAEASTMVRAPAPASTQQRTSEQPRSTMAERAVPARMNGVVRELDF